MHSDGTTSHSTRLPAEELLAGHAKDASQVAGYKLPAEELLAGHPKDAIQVAGYVANLFFMIT